MKIGDKKGERQTARPVGSGRLALSGVIAMGLASATLGGEAQAMSKPDWEGHEKCYGVAKAGQNDCGNAHHQCGGLAKEDGDGEEWLYLPKGTCEKLAGGTLKPSK